jgi:hypothetical protein
VSVGLVEADPLEEVPAMMARADAAMFQAKRDGRDRVVILSADGTSMAWCDLQDSARPQQARPAPTR